MGNEKTKDVQAPTCADLPKIPGDRPAQVAQLLMERVGLDAEAAMRLAEQACAEPLVMSSFDVTAVLSVGSIVRYHTAVKDYAAIVTAVYPTRAVDLVAFGTPFGVAAMRSGVRAGGHGENNSWSWPQE